MLDPLKMPLRGLGLIEASAGTGKTYTIATLYLRLLLESRLEVDQILVVTYTKAATEELRDRIRRRVAQALDWLEQGDQAARRAEDPVLADLLLALPDTDPARVALADALTRMDEAAIHTIHGFCQRALQDHAFESGASFEAEFITDEEHLRATAVADFWRSRVSVAPREEAAWVRSHWVTPDALLKGLLPTLALDDLRLLPAVDQQDVARARLDLESCFRRLQGEWQARGAEIAEILRKSQAINRRSYNRNVVAKALTIAQEVAGAREPPAALPDAFERLTNAGLAKGTKADMDPPSHPFFDLCGDYAKALPRLEALRVALFLITARGFLRDTLDRRKRDEDLLYFDDLLRRLDQALQGDGAEALATSLRRSYPVALIDEFQDTDPQQYRIFRRVYDNQPECGLILIGDPKQAIYAFRGADIFTYMQARDDTDRDGAQYTLGINWRSGSRLITAVNTLFGSAARPFIYEPYICFDPVDPSPRADDAPLLLDGKEPVPFQLWMLRVDADNQTQRPPGLIRKDAAQAAAARACAEHIAGLLNLADLGRAYIGAEPLRPKDIALLVRTHREGDQVQQALRACNVSSVTLSQDSVFTSEDAGELGTLLAALAGLSDEGLVRAALATGLLGYSAAELDRLAADEIAWETVLARFQGYRTLWLERGFMLAFQSLLVAECIGGRLLRRPDGERRLTNLLQLAELLQVAAAEHPGIDALLRWFEDQRVGGECDEDRQLRLESDEGLVKVVTMHKSKGLEYPLVFIPFPWSYFSPPGSATPPFFHDPGDRAACLDLGSADTERHREIERTEQLAERLRLFYVAVTRAAKRCVLCWGRVNAVQDSAMAYLLHRDPDAELPASRMKDLSEEEIREDLEELARLSPGNIAVSDLPKPTGARWDGAGAGGAKLSAARFDEVIDGSWRVSSYSGLVRGEEAERPDYDAATGTEPLEESAALEPTEVESPELIEPPVEQLVGGEGGGVDELAALPAGTHVGHFLHEIFENLDFPEATGEALETTVRDLLERYGHLEGDRRKPARGRTDWAPLVETLVTNVLDTPLDLGATLRLRDIALADRLTEMEFHFAMAPFAPAGLHSLLAGFTDYQATGQGLTFDPTRGLMRGFIDLVFRYDGRFYIVDYKSNRLSGGLGEDPAAGLGSYRRDGLRRAIREHRYDLQYLIYTLALHRYLGQRVPGYDYERHFGGVYYLFLRGMRPAHGPRYGVWYDRPEAELIEQLDRLFNGTREAA